MMSTIKHGLLVAILSGVMIPSVFSQVVPPPPAQINPDTTIIETLRENLQDNIPVISLDESDGQDGSAQNISSQLGAGRDPFLSAATFKFGAVRFRIRDMMPTSSIPTLTGLPWKTWIMVLHLMANGAG